MLFFDVWLSGYEYEKNFLRIINYTMYAYKSRDYRLTAKKEHNRKLALDMVLVCVNSFLNGFFNAAG